MILSAFLGRVQAGVASALADLRGAPIEAQRLWSEAGAALQSEPGLRVFAYLLVVLVVAAGLEWLFWTYAAPGYRWLLAGEPRKRIDAWRIAVRRAGTDISAILLSTIAALAVSAMFALPGAVQDVLIAVVVVVAAARVAGAMAGALVSPAAPRQRLIRMPTREATWTVPAVTMVAGVIVAGMAIPEAIGADAPRLAGAIGVSTAILAGVFLVATVAYLERSKPRSRAPGPQRRRVRLLPRPLVAALWCAVVGLMWLGGAPRWTLTLVVVSVTLVAESASRRAVQAFWTAWRSDRANRDPADAGEVSRMHDPATEALLADLSLRVVRFLVAFAGGIACVIVWDIPILEMTATQTPSGRLMSQLLGAVALLLIADLVWSAAKGWIDAQLSRIAATGHGDPETGANARLLTLLPLGRKALGVALLCIVAFSLLSVFGIAVTPLLAGAGVVGIAIGFGAQTLVRDVLSGVFYLAEDVFRIGDYIEGGSAKGTVERITLRTVALRHQNGPLHFVPYGALGSVRNNSRDWVIDKFEIPLPPDVDSEFIRKLIKKIGEKMMEEPEIAPLIVAPLKTKLYRIEPGVKVFRCKVQTPPGKQFEVRAAAYKRIEAALRDNGIRFADSKSQIILQGPPAAGAVDQPANA
ncbi:MAG: mechanosensitive ion channel [Burkholderiales bacterium]|nr:mechanosensitive ion channel [Burkholderiales bacterium]